MLTPTHRQERWRGPDGAPAFPDGGMLFAARASIAASSAAAPPSGAGDNRWRPPGGHRCGAARGPPVPEPAKTMSTMTAYGGDSEVSPPASGRYAAAASAAGRRRSRSTQASSGAAGEHLGGERERKECGQGRAPIAARSLRPRASVRWPTDSARVPVAAEVAAFEGEVGGNEEVMAPGRRRMAQSSPMPRANLAGPRAAALPAARTEVPHPDRMRSINASSPRALFIVSQA